MALTERTAADIKTVAGFITGWWPGLEDGISWGSNDNELNPVYQAALRLQLWLAGKDVPEPLPEMQDRRLDDRRNPVMDNAIIVQRILDGLPVVRLNNGRRHNED